ncbi:galactomannan galactosyltransferase 1-like [Dioscorea cayenensis subsp. rotundata]|uniref:Galactomannan galactosyltransferase 1-like n=1 Tax=Dioscorea cayennensis subsp. rotundata TaxID=55577 RepID=A0AB40CCW5_DIOCR|nr:galactomannan galactosyltransferase 1-like [Dioscorea cayenensis subsp. rotundata]
MAASSLFSNSLIFAGGTALAVFLFWSMYSFLLPNPTSPTTFPTTTTTTTTSSNSNSKITNWDTHRKTWLLSNPSLSKPLLMLTGSQPTPCRNPIGDHLLLKFYKNKADYCRLHNIDLFYNTALFHPLMPKFWAKLPLLRSAMLAHPEADWLWWVDSDAAITDMDFSLPLHKYQNHNLVVHGWPHLVYEKRSWVSLNAGVFLIRNCQWSLDFMDVWASMGPQTPHYESWGKTLKADLSDKLFDESDDQSALVYLLLHEKQKWGDKIYLENEFYFEGYWLEIVGKLNKIEEKYLEIEKRSPELQERKAEKVAVMENAAVREKYLQEMKMRFGKEGWRRPFITHFTGCQPCSGDHNKMYSGENCWEGMMRALNFADDQVLRNYGFRHEKVVGNESASAAVVRPLPFGFPATG